MAGGVIVRLVRQRADQRPTVAARGEQRQMFDDADAGGARGDGLELAADAVGGVGLGVEAVVLGEAAGEEDEDARRRATVGAEGGEVAEAQAEQADGTGLEGGPAVEGRVVHGGAPGRRRGGGELSW